MIFIGLNGIFENMIFLYVPLRFQQLLNIFGRKWQRWVKFGKIYFWLRALPLLECVVLYRIKLCCMHCMYGTGDISTQDIKTSYRS